MSGRNSIVKSYKQFSERSAKKLCPKIPYRYQEIVKKSKI